MQLFTILSTIIFGVLFVVWSKSHWLNTMIKAAFFVMTVFGIIVSLVGLGMLTAPGAMRWL